MTSNQAINRSLWITWRGHYWNIYCTQQDKSLQTKYCNQSLNPANVAWKQHDESSKTKKREIFKHHHRNTITNKNTTKKKHTKTHKDPYKIKQAKNSTTTFGKKGDWTSTYWLLCCQRQATILIHFSHFREDLPQPFSNLECFMAPSHWNWCPNDFYGPWLCTI